MKLFQNENYTLYGSFTNNFHCYSLVWYNFIGKVFLRYNLENDSVF